MIFLKELTLISAKIHRENVFYVSIIILFKNFNYQRHICDGCHDISVKAISMQNIVIIYHDGHVYRVNFVFMSRNDAFNLMRNSIIIDKKGIL